MRGRPNAASLFFLHKNSRKFWITKKLAYISTMNNAQNNNKMNTWTIAQLLEAIKNVPTAHETHKLATLELCKRTSPTLYEKALREYNEQLK